MGPQVTRNVAGIREWPWQQKTRLSGFVDAFTMQRLAPQFVDQSIERIERSKLNDQLAHFL